MKWSLAGLVLIVLGLNGKPLDESVQYYRVYVYVSTPMTWNQAYKYCTAYYKDLSTITSEETHQRMIEGTDDTFTIGWIGLYRAAGNPNILRWSNGQSYIFTKLNNDDKHFNCAYTTAFEWYMGDCQSQLPFFCHIDYSLWLTGINMAWEDALDYCRYWYNDLASATDQYQLEALKNHSKASITEGVWTGLRFLEGKWHWVSKTFVYIPFRASLPTCPEEPYRCGAYNNRTAQWEMRNCEEKLNFICYQVI